jgi:hypothetical protein
MGAYSFSGTAASNTTVDGIGAAGSDSPDNIDNLVRALAASDANLVRDLGGANTVTGTDTITVALADASTPTYFDGMTFSFRAANDTTSTTPTLNVDSLGAKTIKKAIAGVESALVAGDIQAGGTYQVVYRSAWASAAGAFELLNPETINATSAIIPTITGVTSINSGPLAGFRNHLLNGAMMVAQAGTSFTSTGSANSDDTYNLDQWILLSDGNDIVDVTQSAEAPTEGLNSIALDVETVNKKFGIFQPIEMTNSTGLIGQTVTLSFKAKVSSTTKLDNIKAAIISWDGTFNAVTSDIISAWGVEGTNPTLVANWTYENTPANLGVTTSWATFSVTAAIDTASTKNIGVFIWSDVTDTTLGDFLYITNVQLEIGGVATPFERRPFWLEYFLCERYYRLTKAEVTCGSSTTAQNLLVPFNPPMFAAPSALLLNGTAALTLPGTGTRDISAVGAVTGNSTGIRLTLTHATSTANAPQVVSPGAIAFLARM